MNDNSTPQSKSLSRRDFGKLALGALGGLAVIEAAIVGLGYAAPRVGEGQFGSVITCGQVTEFPNGSVTPFNEGRFYLVRLQDGGFLALYRKCTHLGCVPCRGMPPRACSSVRAMPPNSTTPAR